MKNLDSILIVDDDKIYTYVLSKQLKNIGYSNDLHIFHNAFGALEYLKQLIASSGVLPDMMLVDINMPVMDGWQFLDEFSRFNLNKKITIHIVSSTIDHADHERAATYKQVSHFYTKPVSMKNLSAILEDI